MPEAQNHTLCMSILVLYPCLSQEEWVSPLVYSQCKLDSVVGGWAYRTCEKHKTFMASFTNKKFKCNYVEFDSSSDNEAESAFPRLIIIESSSLPITNLSPFIIEKVISGNLTPISVKKIVKWNTTHQRRNLQIFFWKWLYHNILVKTYPSQISELKKGGLWEAKNFLYAQ